MFAKVFTSLWDGSLRGQPEEQLVMVYLLAHCDAAGEVNVLPDKVGDDTGLGAERVRKALAVLEAPDASSRTPDEDGRRLVRLDEHRDWGWRVVNYQFYRGIRDAEQRREQVRVATARWRQNKKESGSVNTVNMVSRGEPMQRQKQKHTEHLSDESDVPVRNPISTRLPDREPFGFLAFYQAYPRHDGRRAAALEFSRALKRNPTYKDSDLELAAKQFSAQVESEARDPQYIPMPKVWLSQDRFREYFDEGDHAETQEPAEA